MGLGRMPAVPGDYSSRFSSALQRRLTGGEVLHPRFEMRQGRKFINRKKDKEEKEYLFENVSESPESGSGYG